MRDVAEQQGLPQFLVQMRHQAVHESQSITAETMAIALKHLQAYLHNSYWYPILARLIKRNEQISELKR